MVAGTICSGRLLVCRRVDQDWLAAKNISGTIRFYGTPAKKAVAGKLYMARAGVFRDVDAVLVGIRATHKGASKAKFHSRITSAKFRFYGKPAHAAAAPDVGRSALDGLMVMANAVNFFASMCGGDAHSLRCSNGGSAPNVVPEFAELFLLCPKSKHACTGWHLGTYCEMRASRGVRYRDVRMEMELIDSNYNVLPKRCAGGVG